ncbi:hypothetical protein O7614_26620 [Micromonospora sp. WMMD961]|uniref:hypothetical protein n=1 Tax=Micromonospora sp. WMMD961 TaxID=3016100 RepID=UPI002416A03A|nr:hypothetical protein [Micromonospora sp. WMMD961]MDG4783239.1 hypothetical protein [Micromonospora sp. WMMD961]
MAEHYDDSMGQLAKDIVALEPKDLVLAGIYADKRGYHNKRKNLPSSDYSVQLAADKKGPSDKASAIDITSKSAQGGNYTIIKKYSNRLYAAGKAKDPRMAGWREFFGQTDNDGGVEGWDFAKGTESTSADKSHLWHIHLSELREFNTSKDNKLALLSVLSGETLAAYLARGGKLVGKPASTPTKPPAKPPAKPAQLVVDGKLGPATIKRWQQIMGTEADGVISKPSALVKAVQRHLNAHGARLVVDGDGIRQDGRRYQTARYLQRYLGVPVDGLLSTPVSNTVKALQKRLNTGKF